ncbi:hypothetical protein ACYEXS_19615 [Paenibacillus sp. MAH-36]|uniref:RNA helicase n=1 Tax=Paenibacillus violae TaxID=3077234 RepID=A0ABU3R7A8_9BACL|nr:hypothetical protein [Paenibacillus sp. PFR10]MDU0200153.1 hypothetical protein [Paenibacillus sp. PFR10]
MTQKQKLKVGLVMPIASIDGLDPSHWQEVKKIIVDALDENGSYDFETKIVSESESVGLIHKRIVQGLYTSDIVICDVSCKNPNVMFELGMRLGFDKPTIIIKDDKTNYTFDAGVIEHLEYPRDLRFSKILEFKSHLANKVLATYRDSQEDSNHSPFLKSYGEFQSVRIEQTEVSASEMTLSILAEIQNDISVLKTRTNKQQTERKLPQMNLLEVAVMDSLDKYIRDNSIFDINKLSIFDFDLFCRSRNESVVNMYPESDISAAIFRAVELKKRTKNA